MHLFVLVMIEFLLNNDILLQDSINKTIWVINSLQNSKSILHFEYKSDCLEVFVVFMYIICYVICVFGHINEKAMQENKISNDD